MAFTRMRRWPEAAESFRGHLAGNRALCCSLIVRGSLSRSRRQEQFVLFADRNGGRDLCQSTAAACSRGADKGIETT
jgi:hypothetical protein